MRFTIILAIIVPVAVLAQSVTRAAQNPDIPSGFARLGLKTGLGYPVVRLTLSRAGYTPAKLTNDACTSAGGSVCGTYREIEACSGTGVGFCSARFTDRRGRVVAVVTIGPAGRLVRIFANPDVR